jgi:mannosyltransferase
MRKVSRHSWKPTPVALAAAVCLLTAVLGSVRLGAKSLWTDEAFSEAMAHLDLSTMWKATVDGDAFNGFYYTLLHFWRLGGESEAWMRLPSVVFGLLAVYVLFALNKRLFNVWVALFSTVLLAVNPFFVYYEQDARPYTLAVCLVVLATYVFVRAMEQRSAAWWLGYGLVAALAVYAHFFAAFVVVAHLISATFRGSRPRVRDMAAGYALIAVLVAPLAVDVLRTDSLERRFVDPVTLGSFRWLFLNLTGAVSAPGEVELLLLFAYFAVCCGAVLWMVTAAIRRQEEGTDRIWSYALVSLWIGVPVLGSFIASMFRSPIFYPRYLIVVLPALVTIAGIGIDGLRRRSFQVIALVVLVALSIPSLVLHYQADAKEGEDWRRAVAYVTQGGRRGDGIVFLSRFGRRSFEYYLRRHDDAADLRPIYPSAPWGHYVPVLADAHMESTATAAARLRGEYQRVWVVLLWEGFDSAHEEAAPLKAVFDNHYQEEVRRVFGVELQVRLYERTDG